MCVVAKSFLRSQSFRIVAAASVMFREMEEGGPRGNSSLSLPRSAHARTVRSFFGPLAFLLDFIAGKEFGIRVGVQGDPSRQ